MIRDERNRARGPTIVSIETIAVRSPAVAIPAIIDIYNSENNRAAQKKAQRYNSGKVFLFFFLWNEFLVLKESWYYLD